MVPVVHEVIVPLRPNLNFPKQGKPTLIHVHLNSNNDKIQVIEVKHGKKLNLNKYHPFIVEYIENSVQESMTCCSSRYWLPPEETEVTTTVVVENPPSSEISISF